MVDCVLYFEGDRVSDLRILRSIKNRFGKTDEIAMFKMTQSDMEEVKDLSEYFTTHQNEISGVCRGVILQGQRPIIIEVQALLNDSFFGYPRRISEGFSKNRLEVLSAILQKRLKLDLSNKDIYLNIVGGLKVKDTSVDLTVCSAILSMYRSIPIRDKVVVFGEVALSGSIGRTFNAEKRISECARFGAEKIICGNSPEDKKSKISQIMNISELEKALF